MVVSEVFFFFFSLFLLEKINVPIKIISWKVILYLFLSL